MLYTLFYSVWSQFCSSYIKKDKLLKPKHQKIKTKKINIERILSSVFLSCDTTVEATYRPSSLVVHLTVSLHCGVLYRSLIKPLVVVVVVTRLQIKLDLV